jgi:hypothetical protein
MSNRLRQCLRLTQVRSIQHALAAGVSNQAQQRVEQLELSEGQLARLRGGFRSAPGLISGAALASTGELAMRLDLARHDLARTLSGARDQAEVARDARISARRREESARRLGEKSAEQAARKAEKKQVASSPRRARRPGEGSRS